MIRTQPNSKSLCTIEAIALSLSVLEDNEEIAEVSKFFYKNGVWYTTYYFANVLVVPCYSIKGVADLISLYF